MSSAPEARADRNFWLLVGDAGLFSIGTVCFDPNVVLTVFVAQFTTSPLLIGAPAALRLAGLYLPQLPTALGIRNFQHVKGFLVGQAVFGRAALLLSLPAALLAGQMGGDAVLALVLAAYGIFAFTDGAATLAWLDLVGDVVHARLRGPLFGVIQLLGGLGAIGAGLAVRGLLADAVAAADFVPLFAWGCAALFLSALCIAFIRESADGSRPAVDETPLEHMTTLLRRGHLLRLGLAQTLASSLQLALPFYALFGRDRLGLASDWLGSFMVAQTVGASLAGLVWARVAQRHGARLVVSLSGGLLIFVPLFALLGERFGGGTVLLVVFGLAGAANGGSILGFSQYILDLVPARDRRVFVGLAYTANAPSLLMPVAGGLLLNAGGYGLLLAVAMLGGLGAALSSRWLAEPDSRTQK